MRLKTISLLPGGKPKSFYTILVILIDQTAPCIAGSDRSAPGLSDGLFSLPFLMKKWTYLSRVSNSHINEERTMKNGKSYFVSLITPSVIAVIGVLLIMVAGYLLVSFLQAGN